jgi:hypothetical protein
MSTAYYFVHLRHLIFKSLLCMRLCICMYVCLFVCLFVLSVSSVIEIQVPGLCLVRGERGGLSGSRDSTVQYVIYFMHILNARK